MTIQQRLDQLERRNRRLTATPMLLPIALCAVLTLYGLPTEILAQNENTQSIGFVAGPTHGIRIGESPVGPFGPRIDTYRTQEPDAGQEIYTYNAKAHPSLSPTGEWLVTYNVNSRDWDSLVANGDIYRPRFLWVRFEAE